MHGYEHDCEEMKSVDKVQAAIKRIKFASESALMYYGKPIEVQYSGGKDSDVLVELFRRSDVPFAVNHSLTTADPPEIIYHIYEQFARWEGEGIRCNIDRHEFVDEGGKKRRVTMWNLIPKKMAPPTRIMRYCCAELKEGRGESRYVATGVRRAESVKRSKRNMFEKTGSKASSRSYTDTIMLNSDNDKARMYTEHCLKKTKWL